MAHKDFFADIDPLSEVRDTVPLIPTKAMPVYKEPSMLDDLFVDKKMSKDSVNVEQMKEDMRLMYRMIEGTRDDMRQKEMQRDREYAELREEIRDRDHTRERDMLTLMEKLSDLQLTMAAKKEVTKDRISSADSQKLDLDHSIIIIIIIIFIFKEDNVFSIIANLPYGPPMNTDIDYYRT